MFIYAGWPASLLAFHRGFDFKLGWLQKKATPAPPQVQVITLTPTNVPIFEEWIGTLDGFVNAQIHAQVTGYLLSQNYTEGSEVKQGDLLFQIDPRPFQAGLDQALARLAQDRAQAGKTEEDVKRYTPLARNRPSARNNWTTQFKRIWQRMHRSRRTKPPWKMRS